MLFSTIIVKCFKSHQQPNPRPQKTMLKMCERLAIYSVVLISHDTTAWYTPDLMVALACYNYKYDCKRISIEQYNYTYTHA